jgi:hypothetical protein
MTDQHPSDEVVSAYLDGEATPTEAAAVEASAPARARRDELDAVRAQVGEPVVPPIGARDAAVAAALAVHDHEMASAPAGTTTGSAAPAGAADLAAHRARRRPRRVLAPVLGAVASVVFVVAVAAIALQQTRSSTDYSTAGAAADSAQEVGGAPEPNAAATGGAPPAAQAPGFSSKGDAATEQADRERSALAAGAAPANPDLGVIADAGGLRRAVAGALTSPAMATTTSGPPALRGRPAGRRLRPGHPRPGRPGPVPGRPGRGDRLPSGSHKPRAGVPVPPGNLPGPASALTTNVRPAVPAGCRRWRASSSSPHHQCACVVAPGPRRPRLATPGPTPVHRALAL